MKTRFCPGCNHLTPQELVPLVDSSGWKCQECNGITTVYTLEEMAAVVQSHFFKLPEKVEMPPIEPCRVFIERHGLGEAEVLPEAILEHVQLTGKLPAVGHPLFTSPVKGNKLFALPYGKVVRIEEAPGTSLLPDPEKGSLDQGRHS